MRSCFYVSFPSKCSRHKTDAQHHYQAATRTGSDEDDQLSEYGVLSKLLSLHYSVIDCAFVQFQLTHKHNWPLELPIPPSVTL